MTWQLEGPFQISDGEIEVKQVSLAEGFSSTTLKYTSINWNGGKLGFTSFSR